MSEIMPRGRGGSIVGLILIGLGVVFALGQVFRVNFLAFTWPFFIIVPGLMFFVMMVVAGKPGGPLAIPGSIVTTVGLILLFQSVTGLWYTWAYAWALIIPTSIGAGMMIAGRWSGSAPMSRSGRQLVTVGMIIFLIAGAVFELVLNIGNNPFVPYLWPALMIVLGVWLLVWRGRSMRTSEGIHATESYPTPPPAPARPRPAKAPAAPAAPQFEPLDPMRGKKKVKTPESTGEPKM